MEDQNQALNPEADITAQPESPTAEQIPEVQTEVSTETPEVPKKGAQNRIREVISENKSLKERIAELTNPVGSQAPQMPTPPQEKSFSEPDGSIDPNEFKRQVLLEANQIIDFRTRQSVVMQNINATADELVRKYGELDPDSDTFNQELNDDVYEIVEAKLKADPTAIKDVKKIVAKQIELHRRATSREEAKTQAVISKQAAQSAIRPTQNKPVDTKFEDLSIDEMRAKLGYAPS